MPGQALNALYKSRLDALGNDLNWRIYRGILRKTNQRWRTGDAEIGDDSLGFLFSALTAKVFTFECEDLGVSMPATEMQHRLVVAGTLESHHFVCRCGHRIDLSAGVTLHTD